MVEEKQTILQRLEDEVTIRHQAENLFDEEKIQLSKLLEIEMSKRCQGEQQEMDKIHKQLQKDMKKRQTAEQERYVLLYQQQQQQ